jgi:hypothetical protein
MSGLLTATVVRMRRSVFVMFMEWGFARKDWPGDWLERIARIDRARLLEQPARIA